MKSNNQDVTERFIAALNAPIHTTLVREDGTIEDTVVETFYVMLEDIAVADEWLRVFADNGVTNVETRIPFTTLEAMGWTRKEVPSDPELTKSADAWRGPEGGGFRTYLTKKGEGVAGDEVDPLNDLNACAELISFLKESGWTCTLENGIDDAWYCSFRRFRGGITYVHRKSADKLAEAICRAFIATMESVEPKITKSASVSGSPEESESVKAPKTHEREA